MPEEDIIAADAWIQAILPFLEEGNTFQISPHGMSMFPFLLSDRDSVILEKIEGKLKPLDIVLFRRKNGTYILHRIIKCKNSSFDIVGDNETLIERDVQLGQIVARASHLIRNGKKISCENLTYRLLSKLWLLLLPLRPWIVKVRVGVYRKFHI